ncbi:MAG: phosphatase PAP2 family protein [Ignavibacteriales bacterium]|nr:phosphatase PAP2 family protein [Ignavibacteriales bacterium]
MDSVISHSVSKYLLLLFFLFSILTNHSYPQPNENNTHTPISFNQVINDGKELVLSPLRWEQNDWLTFGAIAGGTILLTTIDLKMQEESQELVHNNNFPMKLGKWTGEPIAIFSIAGGFYLLGTAFKDETAKQIGFEITESFIYSGVIDVLLKASFGRFRPYTQKGNGNFHPFTFMNNDRLSFPSGHSTVAFSLATVIASHTNNYFLKAIIYTPAILTLYQRVYSNQHWTSDVFAGAAIGYFVGNYIINKHKQENANGDKYSFGFDPNGRINFSLNF